MLGRIFNYETSRKFRSFLSRHGVSLRFSANTRPVDFTDQPGIDPIAAIYQAGGRPVLLKVPLKDCVFFSHLAFPCTPDSPSPQIQTLIEYGKGNIKNWEESPLVDFYNNFQPKNAAELMGLPATSHTELNEQPPSVAGFPWNAHSSEELQCFLKTAGLSEFKQYGYSNVPQESGSQFFGPASESRICLEFNRLTKTYNSISERSFAIDYEGINNIEALILINNHKNKYLIIEGQHRTAALTALDKSSIIIQIKTIYFGGKININEAKYWPQVVNGRLDVAVAEQIFNRIFEAKQPLAYIQRRASEFQL